ncbi:MAG: carbon-nitrogen hydrolase family protein [Clostridia bacterium]|nr:carbon-nitrogen hydrolase family protein [Clostridia bacterium]
MKIAACQFAVSGDMLKNDSRINHAVVTAAAQGAQLLVFPECALTGYPPRDIPNSSAVDSAAMATLLDELGRAAMEHGMCIVLGTITRENSALRNSAAILLPDGRRQLYHKRALWGWDRDNFVPGSEPGIFELDGLKIGVRICYEVRFPEYFRELYAAGTDLNLVLFYDVSDRDDVDRYDLIKAHLRTRAAENVTPLLSTNAIHPFQTAPTAFFDRSGNAVHELIRNADGMLVFEFSKSPLDFSEVGRKYISDSLV